MQEESNLRGSMAQRDNVKKRDAWTGNDAFVPNVQPVAARAGTASQDLCVCTCNWKSQGCAGKNCTDTPSEVKQQPETL